MKHLRLSDMKIMPWKNGQGTTTEIVVRPEGASVADMNFVWRASAAEIRADGPFSTFEGYERILVNLGPGSVSIRQAGEKIELLPFKPFRFAGEDDVSVQLPMELSSIVDFGIIFDRSRVDATVSVLALSKGATAMIPLESEFQTHLIFAGPGPIEVRNTSKGREILQIGEAVLIETPERQRHRAGRSLVSISSVLDSYVIVAAIENKNEVTRW